LVHSLRYSNFAIREIDLGLASDIGSLQFFPQFTGNSSAFKELAFTGRLFGAEEAQRIGFVSRVFESREEMRAGVELVARDIASKSPVGVYAIKKTIMKGEREIYAGLDCVK
jgi:enoyl-CoA hydratase/carnithine racemase